MKLSTYTPNFRDPRIVKRSLNVISWCEIYLSETTPKQVPIKTIIKQFGNNGNDLGLWLRANLLIQVGNYSIGGECYKYLFKKSGADKIKLLINTNFSPDKERQKSRRTIKNEVHTKISTSSNNFEILYQKYASSIATGNFEYIEKEDRLYHELQNLPRKQKEEFWKGYLGYDYDIDASAPTLLAQYAEKCGLSPLLNDTLREYLADKTKLRAYLSKLLDIDMDISKKIINALFNGAKLSTNTQYPCSIFKLLEYEITKMELLRKDKEIAHLRRNIKYIWNKIKIVELGRNKHWNKSQKWNIYFKLERSVMDIIYSYLQKKGIIYFKEHDGYRTNKEINLSEIENEVFIKSGYKIKISKKGE